MNSYSCNCDPGYTGNDCSINIDDCNPNPCQYGGNCTVRQSTDTNGVCYIFNFRMVSMVLAVPVHQLILELHVQYLLEYAQLILVKMVVLVW